MVNQQAIESRPQVTIVHEWFASIGGSENVATAMLESFADADLYCLWLSPEIELKDVHVSQSILARWPFHGRKALSLPLMPFVWRRTGIRKNNAEVVLVSSHLFAHHVHPGPSAQKLVYVHTPARYIWEPDFDERGRSLAARAGSAFLKPLDRLRAREAKELAANSHFVRERISRAWGRDSRVIYPPVDVADIQATADWTSVLSGEDSDLMSQLPTCFILGASRFVSYKRLDVVISVGERADLPVVLAGAGPDEQRLRGIAGEATVPVVFVPRPSTALLRALYQRAMLYVFPPVEDFGIMPVEAMAAGTPVLANSIGGASESVIDGITGALFDMDSSVSLNEAMTRALSVERVDISSQAVRFSKQRFQEEIRGWVSEYV